MIQFQLKKGISYLSSEHGWGLETTLRSWYEEDEIFFNMASQMFLGWVGLPRGISVCLKLWLRPCLEPLSSGRKKTTVYKQKAGLKLELLNGVHTPLCSKCGLSTHQVINVSSCDVHVLSEPEPAKTIKSLFIFPWVNWERLIAGDSERVREQGHICIQWVNISAWKVQYLSTRFIFLHTNMSIIIISKTS